MKARKYTKETINEIGVYKRSFPQFNIGDTIAVSQRVKEGNKERIQIFQGDVIAMRKRGASSTVTVRKIGANSIAVEKIFPFYAPVVADIKVTRYGSVRRAKIYYVRDKVGKAARVKEKVLTRQQKEDKKQYLMFEDSIPQPKAKPVEKKEDAKPVA